MSAQRSTLTSLRRIPAMNNNPAITASRHPALEGDLVGLDAACTAAVNRSPASRRARRVRSARWRPV